MWKCTKCGWRVTDLSKQFPPCFEDGNHDFARTPRDAAPHTPLGKEYDLAQLRTAVQSVLKHHTADPEALANTPGRFVSALGEMLSGYRDDPKEILSKTFEDSYDAVVILTGVPFSSVCEHHLFPFYGTADVGYLPGKVVGLSKLARLVDCYARRLQLQERLARQTAEALMEHLEAKGAAVVIRGQHSCMACRGVKKDATMVTSCMLGAFRDDAPARAEFLALCR